MGSVLVKRERIWFSPQKLGQNIMLEYLGVAVIPKNGTGILVWVGNLNEN